MTGGQDANWQQQMRDALQPFVWSTGDVDAVAAALMPVLEAAQRDAAAKALEDAADNFEDDEQGYIGRVAADELRDRAATHRAKGAR